LTSFMVTRSCREVTWKWKRACRLRPIVLIESDITALRAPKMLVAAALSSLGDVLSLEETVYLSAIASANVVD
jgi:hypothetical protein